MTQGLPHFKRHRDLLRRGTVLVDEHYPGVLPRVLLYLEHAIQDASLLKNGDRRTISKQMLYVELDPSLFGDASELRSGSVARKVNMRVSVIDESILKEIDTRRNALRTLLTKFKFGTADNMRWMPNAARDLPRFSHPFITRDSVFGFGFEIDSQPPFLLWKCGKRSLLSTFP